MSNKPKAEDALSDNKEHDESRLDDKVEDSPTSERSYYYDDAHGYEDYTPDPDDEASED